MTRGVTALGFVRVLDLSDNVAGQFCARMLADQGAEVLLIKPPGGSALRCRGPRLDAGDSLQFVHLNLGKQSLELDLGTEAGRRALRELAEAADVALVPAGFDREPLLAGQPRLIVALVSPFGEDGPLAHWRGSEIVYQAMSGSMIHNGEAGREPLHGVGDRASYCAGIAAYVAVLAALMQRERRGVVQDVAVDIAHNAAAMTYPFALQHAYNGVIEERGRRDAPLVELQCRDTWLSIWVKPAQFRAVCEALQAPELVDDERFATPAARRLHLRAFEAALQRRASGLCAADVVRALQAQRVVAACCFRASQLGPDAPHLAARGYWQRVDTPDGPRHVLGPQFRMSATPRVPVQALRNRANA